MRSGKEVLESDKKNDEVCTVDWVFFTMGLVIGALFFINCIQMSARNLQVTPYYMLQDPMALLKMAVFSFVTPCCLLAPHGGAIKSPALLAIGVALSGIMLTLITALAFIAYMWFFSGGRFQVEKDGWCASESASSEWLKAAWCSELFYLGLINIAHFLSTIFFWKVIKHWVEVNNMRANKKEYLPIVDGPDPAELEDCQPYTFAHSVYVRMH